MKTLILSFIFIIIIGVFIYLLLQQKNELQAYQKYTIDKFNGLKDDIVSTAVQEIYDKYNANILDQINKTIQSTIDQIINDINTQTSDIFKAEESKFMLFLRGIF